MLNATKFLVVLGLISAISSVFFIVRAEDYTSPNFILRDPVITIEGGRSTSTSFELFSSAGQTVGGENTSLSFIYRSGFLYFPVATAPILTAGAGDSQVNLSWTASVATLANITSYDVGISTVSGGPYTFESVGNTLSFTKTGLTSGVPYYFQVQANAGILTLAKSNEASATPSGEAPPPPPPPPLIGGGGIVLPLTGVSFSGRAYPLSNVTILKDGQIAVTTIAGPDANFYVSLTGLSAGNYIFSVYGEDSRGNRSTTFNFSLFITEGVMTRISGIFLAPTISVDKSEVVRGDNIAIFGQSIPSGEITIGVSSEEEIFGKTKSDKDGVYLYYFDTSPLEFGKHFTRSKAAIGWDITSFSRTISFLVGTKTVKAEPVAKCPLKADLNGDCRVNLIDFSIAAYWYKRPLSPQFIQKEIERLNGDGKIDLIDFSIMAYYWTG